MTEFGDDRLPPRLWERVQLDGETGCWVWVGSKHRNGYGQCPRVAPYATRLVHRVAYQALVGPIPGGMELDHLCRVRSCINPSHLEVVTRRTNVLRSECFAARYARTTHCPQGHEYTDENTYLYRGGRHCRACRRAENQRYQAKKRANR